ncbi:MAG: hypothetical protein U0802_19125 [Candidatus Binatia bacterium]
MRTRAASPHRRPHPEDVRGRTGLALRADGSAAPAGAVDPFAPLPDGIAAGARLHWSGQVYWPSDRPPGLALRAAPALLQVGDRPPLVAGGDGTATDTATLPRGWQPIRIEETAAAGRALRLELSATDRRRR